MSRLGNVYNAEVSHYWSQYYGFMEVVAFYEFVYVYA